MPATFGHLNGTIRVGGASLPLDVGIRGLEIRIELELGHADTVARIL
jgi:hypothetical protein